MTCTVCGAEAAIRRDAAFYCGKCAVARDWGDVIARVQEGPHSGERVEFDEAVDAEDAGGPVPAASSPSADPFSA